MNDVQKTTQQLVEFSITDAVINELAVRFENPKVPEGKEEYEQLKADIQEVARWRIATDKERKVQNAAALAHQRGVNAEGGRIIDELKAIEAPMRACKAEVDDAEAKRVADREEQERDRLDKIHARIERIVEFGKVSITDTLEDVKKRLVRVEELDTNDGFDEYAKNAAVAQRQSRLSLQCAIDQLEERAEAEERQRKYQEEMAERGAELDEQERKQKAEQARLDKEKDDREAEERRVEQARLKKLEDEERDRKEKAEAEAEAERQKELAPDKEKLQAFANSLRTCQKPVCKSVEAKSVVNRAISRLDSLADGIEHDAGEL